MCVRAHVCCCRCWCWCVFPLCVCVCVCPYVDSMTGVGASGGPHWGPRRWRAAAGHRPRGPGARPRLSETYFVTQHTDAFLTRFTLSTHPFFFNPIRPFPNQAWACSGARHEQAAETLHTSPRPRGAVHGAGLRPDGVRRARPPARPARPQQSGVPRPEVWLVVTLLFAATNRCSCPANLHVTMFLTN